MISSDFIQGMMRLPDWKLSRKELLLYIHQLIDLGICAFDHADIYGNHTCELLFGKAIAQEPELRKKMQLISKCGIVLEQEKYVKHYNLTKEHIIRSVETSLQNLKTDYLDYLLLHRPSPIMNPSEVAEAFHILHQQGKVNHFGVSNFTIVQIQYLQSFLDIPLAANQIELSPLQLLPFKDGSLNYLHQQQMQVMAWSPMAGGQVFKSGEERAHRLRLALQSIADEMGVASLETLVYAWIMHHPASIIPIIGSGKITHAQQAVQAKDLRITDEQWFRIWQASNGERVP